MIAGAGRLVKQGAGTLTLSGANTYVGGATLAGGTLAVAGDAGSGAGAGAGPAGTLRKTGAGTLRRAAAANTYSGATQVLGGVLVIRSDQQLGAAPLAVVAQQLVLDGGTLRVDADTTMAASRGLWLGDGGGLRGGGGWLDPGLALAKARQGPESGRVGLKSAGCWVCSCRALAPARRLLSGPPRAGPGCSNKSSNPSTLNARTAAFSGPSWHCSSPSAPTTAACTEPPAIRAGWSP